MPPLSPFCLAACHTPTVFTFLIQALYAFPGIKTLSCRLYDTVVNRMLYRAPGENLRAREENIITPGARRAVAERATAWAIPRQRLGRDLNALPQSRW